MLTIYREKRATLSILRLLIMSGAALSLTGLAG